MIDMNQEFSEVGFGILMAPKRVGGQRKRWWAARARADAMKGPKDGNGEAKPKGVLGSNRARTSLTDCANQ
jgi:hypothetical protein